MYSTTRMLLIGQLSSILFAAILAFIPQYYIIGFILYLAVVIGLNTLMQRRVGKGKKERITAARILFKEEKAMEIALKDDKLMEELSAQTKMMTMSFLGLGIAFVVFWSFSLFREKIVEDLEPILASRELSYFVYWITVFETIFILNRIITWKTIQGKTIQQPIMPNKYIITETGIAAMGFGGVSLEFPFPEDYEVVIDERRSFVEIRIPKGRKLRLYSKSPRRLYDLIMSLNERAKRRKARETRRKE